MSDLHANHAIYEENDGNEGGDPGQGLEGLDKCVKQGSDPVPLWEQFHYSENTEETEEGNRYHVSWLEKYRVHILERQPAHQQLTHADIHERSNHNEEIKGIPGVTEIILDKTGLTPMHLNFSPWLHKRQTSGETQGWKMWWRICWRGPKLWSATEM